MHPPVEDAVLQHNPEFAALYKTLTTAVLNPDCSTKNDPARKEREAVKEELNKHRLQTAKHRLLISALSTANPSEKPPSKPVLRRPRGAPHPPPSTPSPLPRDLLDLLLLLPPLLSTPHHLLAGESLTLLLTNPPLTSLPTLLPTLAPLLSSTLTHAAVSLARLLNPSTNPSFLHRAVPALPTTTASLLTTLASTKHLLSHARTDSATLLTRLLALRAASLAHLLRALEAKHGAAARALELRAAETALAAHAQAARAAALADAVWADVYDARAAAALARYAAHLRDAKARVGEEARRDEAELRRYGVGVRGDEARERTLREMARVYRDMGRQVEEVRRDLERLGGRA